MANLRLTASAIFTSALIFSANAALAADWKLVEVTGAVRVAEPGKAPSVAQVNQTIPVGSSVTTASGGRAALFNGAQKITLGANSRMVVAPEKDAGMVRIAQDLGSILFQVDKKPSKHFRVDTPLLAAIVKGTTFTVNVGPGSDTVHVAEGLVEVRPAQGGQGADIPAGATGAVSREQPGTVNKTTPGAGAAAPAGKMEPLNYAALSEGLVQSAPVQLASLTTPAAASAAPPAQAPAPAVAAPASVVTSEAAHSPGAAATPNPTAAPASTTKPEPARASQGAASPDPTPTPPSATKPEPAPAPEAPATPQQTPPAPQQVAEAGATLPGGEARVDAPPVGPAPEPKRDHGGNGNGQDKRPDNPGQGQDKKPDDAGRPPEHPGNGGGNGNGDPGPRDNGAGNGQGDGNGNGNGGGATTPAPGDTSGNGNGNGGSGGPTPSGGGDTSGGNGDGRGKDKGA